MQQSRLQTIENQLKKLSKKINCSTQFYDSIQDFPEVGSLCAIYIDRSTGAVYIYDEDTDSYVSSDTGLTPELSGSGSSGQVAYWTGATTLSGESALYYDAANNRLGVNQPVPAYPLDVVGNTRIQGNLYTIGSSSYLSSSSDALTYTGGFYTFTIVNNGPASIGVDRFSSNTTSPHFNLRKSRGTITSPSVVTSGDELGYVGFWGHDGTSFQRNGTILVKAANVTGSTITPTMQFGLGTSAGTTQYHINLYNTGNTSFGNSTPDLNARVGIRGSGTTSATTALLIQNSTPTNLLTVRDDGVVYINNGSLNFGAAAATNPKIFAQNGLGVLSYSSPSGISVESNLFTGSEGYDIYLTRLSGTRNVTTGTNGHLALIGGYNPTSGTGTYVLQSILGTINQTGGANGITRGLYVNPTLTSAADWRSIETSNNTGWAVYTAGTANSYFGGNVGIGTTTPGASFETTSSIRMSGAGSQTFEFSAATRGQFRAIFGGFSFRSSTGVFISNADGDPSARLHVRGSGTTSSTTALLVQNSTPTDLFRIYDNGSVVIGTGLAGFVMNGNTLEFKSNLAGITSGIDFRFDSAQGNNSATSGVSDVIRLRSGSSQAFNPTSGTGVLNIINIPTTINQTGGANGITRGLYVNPTLTSAADWRGVEIATSTVNTVVLGKNTGSAAVEVTSTTQGFLPPRMTTAQRDLIATPAAGLVIFNTTTTKLECFDGAVWQAAW